MSSQIYSLTRTSHVLLYFLGLYYTHVQGRSTCRCLPQVGTLIQVTGFCCHEGWVSTTIFLTVPQAELKVSLPLRSPGCLEKGKACSLFLPSPDGQYVSEET